MKDFIEDQSLLGYSFDLKREPPVVFGPTLMIHLLAGFGLQGDAIFRRYNARVAGPGGFNLDQQIWLADSAALVRWQWNRWPVTPFVNSGAGFRTFIDLDDLLDDIAGGDFSLGIKTSKGFVLGGGVRFRLGPLKVAPEIRWWRFERDAFQDLVNPILRTNRDQTDFLIGFYF